MNKGILIAVCFLSLSLLIVGCTSNQKSVETVFEVAGINGSVSLTMDDLQSMPAIEGWSGTLSSTGVITPPMQIKGVSLVDLVDLVGGLQSDMGINVVAKDGYSITMSYDQISNGSFATYDPGTGNERKVDDPLVAVVAYERDGKSIPEDEDGPLRIFILSPSNNQIVDGHWSVKWVEKLQLKLLAEDWVLYLEGTITEDLDRASFESCTAPGCHATSWVDGEGNAWNGVPLYLLAGRVDDGNVHEERAYDDDYAAVGYALDLFSADGTSVSIQSSQSDFNETLLVASQLNGESLSEEQFPLRLVGDGLDDSQMVSRVAQIVIVPNEGVATPSSDAFDTGQEEDFTIDYSLPEGMALKVVGDLRNQLLLSLDNLEALGVVELELEHPKKGSLSYKGVRLNILLSLAGVNENATILLMTASDGFGAEVPLTELETCENCLVALETDGTLSMAMDGMDSGFWVKEVIHLYVK